MKKVFLVFIFFSTFIFYANSEELTIEDAIECANNSSITLAIAKEELNQSLRTASTISSYLPELSLTGSVSTGGSFSLGYSNPFSADINVGVSWNLGTSIIGKEEKAAIERLIAELNYETSEDTLESTVVTSYLLLVSRKNNLIEANRKYESVIETYKNTLEKYENGLVSELTLLEAESSLRNAEYSLKSYNALYELALQSFRNITNIEDDFTLQDIEIVLLDLPSAESLYENHKATITAIKQKDAEIAKSQVNLTQTKVSNLYPSVNLSTGYNAGANTKYQSSLSGSLNDDFYLKVSISVPITSYIKGSSGDTAVKNAESNVTIAKLSKQQTQKDTISAIAEAIYQIASTEDSITLAKENYELSKKTLELTKEAYDAGFTSFSELNNAEDNLFYASITLSNKKVNYLSQIYTLASTLSINVNELYLLYRR